MKDSKFLGLNLKDFLKGIIMAILTPVVVLVQQSLDKGQLHFDWKALGMAAIGGFLAYLIKNFLTPPSKPSDANESNNNITDVNH